MQSVFEKEISICLLRGLDESVGNDHVSNTPALSMKWLGGRKTENARRDRLG